MLDNYCGAFHAGVERAISDIGSEKYDQLLSIISKDTNTISCVYLKVQKERYVKCIETPRKVVKSKQNACGPDIPAEVDGCLKECYLIKNIR